MKENRMRDTVKNLFRKLPYKLRKTIWETIPSQFPEPLYRQLPLSVPQSVHIDLTNLCNFRCSFCPTGNPALLEKHNRPKGVMELELFKNIIDELRAAVLKHGVKITELHLYKDGEPLINKHAAEMCRYAADADIAGRVGITTNAALMSPEISDKLIESGIDEIRISVEHVSDEGYREVTRNYGDYETILSNVRYFYKAKEESGSSLRVLPKIITTPLSEAEVQKFRDDFGEVSDKLLFNEYMGWSGSDEYDFTQGYDVDKGMGGELKLKERKVCPEPFCALAVNFNGQVSVCCVDWTMGTVIGDFRTRGYEEIWNGKELNEFRLKHLNGSREEIEACRGCHYIKGFSEYSRLDDIAGELKKLYGAQAGEKAG